MLPCAWGAGGELCRPFLPCAGKVAAEGRKEERGDCTEALPLELSGHRTPPNFGKARE